MRIAEEDELIEQCPDQCGDTADFGPDKQFYIEEYLIIPGTAGMDFFAGIADTSGEEEFNLGVYIFHAGLQGEIAGADLVEYQDELLVDEAEFICPEEADLVQHFGMRHGADDIVFGQEEIEIEVLADGKFFDHFSPLGIIGRIFLPDLHDFRFKGGKSTEFRSWM